MDRQYIAFISYRHAPLDSAVAKTLHTEIEGYKIPKMLRNSGEKKLGLVFRDQEELSVSSDLTEDIYNALDHSKYLVVVCSKDTIQSPWVSREIEYFLRHHDRKNVFTVLASGEPGEVFPKLLTQITDEAGNAEEVEPLAVDARADNIRAMRRKLRREIMRLYAAMIGCSYDALVLRQQHRQKRQLAGILSMILLVALSFSAVLLVKNRQIDLKNSELERVNQVLEQTNEELLLQKAEVQLRESELLTNAAQEALTEGNNYKAIENAASALPSAEENRPYYAPAEQVLFSALGIFEGDSSDYVITRTNIEQTTPIADYIISENGSYLATLDQYGVISCYDTANGDVIWNLKLDLANIRYVSSEAHQLFLSSAGNSMVVFVHGFAAEVSFEDGAIKWFYDDYGSSHGLAAITDNSEMLVYLKQEYDGETNHYAFNLIYLSTKSGEVLYTVTIAKGTPYNATSAEDPGIRFSHDWLADIQLGAFSPDGTYFAGGFFEENIEGGTTLCYYLVDLKNGTSRIIYKEAIEAGYYNGLIRKLYFCGDNAALLALRENEDSSVAVTVEKIDLDTGTMLWQTESAPERDIYFYNSSGSFVSILTARSLLVGRSNVLYVFDLENGKQEITDQLDADIVSLEPSGKYFFSFVLSDGRYTLMWMNDSGVHYTDLYFGQSISLGETSNATLYNEGFLFLSVDGDKIGTLYTRDDNYVVNRPIESNRCIVIHRVVYQKEYISCKSTDILEDNESLSDENVTVCDDGTLIFGRIYQRSDDWSDSSYCLKTFDPVTCTCIDTMQLEEDISRQNLYPLPDGSGYIDCNDYGDVSLYNAASNTVTTLMEGTLFDYAQLSSSTLRTADNKILSVACDGTELSVWLNGIPQNSVSLPADARWSAKAEHQPYRFLSSGSNGYVMLNSYYDLNDMVADGAIVWDSLTDTWYQWPLENILEEVYFADALPYFAVIDSDGVVHVCEITTGETICAFPLNLPQNSIQQMKFILDDNYLLVTTQDCQLLIFQIETGEVMYKQQMDSAISTENYVYEDAVNQRLYITGGCTDTGICLDLTSWTKLGDISGLLFYHARTNSIYCYGYRDGESRIWAWEVPSTEKLVEMAYEVIGHS